MKKSNAGLDGIGFELILDANHSVANLEDRTLVTPDGKEYGKIEVRSGRARMYLCLPRYVRTNNVMPFGLADMGALDAIRSALKRELDSVGNRGNCWLNSVECNLTQRVNGAATPDQVLNLLHRCYADKTNLVYEGPSKRCKFHKEKETLIVRSKNYYVLKCYNKTLQQRSNGNTNVEDGLLRIEVVMQGRIIRRLFGERCNIFDVLQEQNLRKVIAEYKRIFVDDIMGKYITPGLDGIRKVLLESLMETNKLPLTVYQHKEIIVDVELLRDAVKKWHEMWDEQDNSRQDLHRCKKYDLPKDTIKTMQAFLSSCG